MASHISAKTLLEHVHAIGHTISTANGTHGYVCATLLGNRALQVILPEQT